jgi:hypothetical protein
MNDEIIGIVEDLKLRGGIDNWRSFQQVRSLGGQLYNRFPEKGIGPREPVSSDRSRIVDREGLVDKVVAGLRLKTGQALSNFLVAGGGEYLGDEGKRPNCALIGVRTANAPEFLVLVVVRVFRGKHEFPSVAVHLILLSDEAEVGKRDQRGQVCVIENHRITLTVDFVSKNAFPFVSDHSESVNCLFYALCCCLHSFAQYRCLPLQHRFAGNCIKHFFGH